MQPIEQDRVASLYRESSAHKVKQVLVLNLDDGDRDRLLILLSLGDLGSLLRHNGGGIESLEQHVPKRKPWRCQLHMRMRHCI